MPSKLVLITWDMPDNKEWLAEDNIAIALHAYCPNTKFRIVPEKDIVYANTAQQSMHPTSGIRKWYINFCENGDEYTGSLTVTAKELHCDEANNKGFWADGVFVEIYEPIISVEELGVG